MLLTQYKQKFTGLTRVLPEVCVDGSDDDPSFSSFGVVEIINQEHLAMQHLQELLI